MSSSSSSSPVFFSSPSVVCSLHPSVGYSSPTPTRANTHIKLIRKKNILDRENRERRKKREKEKEKKRDIEKLIIHSVCPMRMRANERAISSFSFELSPIRPYVRSREREKERNRRSTLHLHIHPHHIEHGSQGNRSYK